MKNISMSRRIVVPATLALFAVAAARPAGDQGARTIGGSDPVTIEFMALGKDGKPVTDLKPEEVTLSFANKPRPLQGLRFMTVSTGGTGAAALAPPFGTNDESGNGRSITLVVDHKSFRTGNEGDTRNAINKLLDALPASDRVALLTIPEGSDLVPSTTDRGKVKAALANLQGLASNPDLRGDGAACRSVNTLNSLIGLFTNFAMSGEPQMVALFSSNLSGPRASVTMTSAGGSAANIGMCELAPEKFQQVGAAAAAAHVRLYIFEHDITVSSTTGDASTNTRGSDHPRIGLENIASLTGAPIFALATPGESPLLKMVTETTGYYVARFEPEQVERNGVPRKLEVKVTRPDVTVRAASELTVGKAEAKPKPSSKDMVKEPKVYRDLPLRVSGYTSRGAEGKVQVLFIVEPGEAGTKLASATIGLIDASGKITQWTPQAADLEKPQIVSALLMAPGKYRLRAAATDAAGRAGTADFEMNAELTPAGPMKLSGLALGTKDAGFTPKLEFRSEAEAVAYFELYGTNPGKPIKLVVELAATPDGPALATGMPALAAPQPDRFTVLTPFKIDALAPGDYVVRATFSVEGEPEGKIYRTLRKVK